MKNTYLLFILFAFSITIRAQVCFVPHADYNTGAFPYMIDCADFNNDGNNDLVLPNLSDATISVYLGNGTGVFNSYSTYSTVTLFPQGIHYGNFNPDAFLDLVFTAGGNVNVMLNNGNGTFAAPTVYTGGGGAYDLTSGDYNGDGFVDLVSANQTGGNISLYLGNGTGGFGPRTNFAAASSPYAVVSADLNGDGFLDAATANNGASSVSVLIGNGSGGFATRVNYTTDANPTDLVAVDVDSDGDKDIVTTNVNSGNVNMLINNGTGVYAPAIQIACGSTNSSGIVTRDFNGDTKADLAISSEASNAVIVLLGNGSGGFGSPLNFTTDISPRYLCSGDVNNDGRPDVITTNAGGNNTISVLLNQQLPTVQASASDTAFCQGASVTLNGIGADGYTWAPAATNGVAFIPTAPSTYTVTGTTNGCANTDTLTLNVLALPTLNLISTSFSVCIGSAAMLDATGDASSYTWDNGVTNAVAFYPSASIPYTVIATAANGCIKTATVSISVNQLPSAVISASPNDVCAGTFVLNSIGSTGGTVYNWTGPTNGTPAGTNPNASSTGVSVSGTYTLSLTNTSTTCTDTATRNINFLPLPNVTASATDSFVCSGTQIALIGGGANSYTWSGGVLDNTPFSLNASQTYTVTGTDNDGCTNTAIVLVSVYETPTPEICMVTVDDPGNNNIIYWDKTIYLGVDSFFVYRETSNNIYQIIGKVPYDSLSLFIDTVRTLYFPNTGNPRNGAYKYKLAIKDTCGNVGPMSLYHATMFLQDQLNGNFNWTHYEIEGQTTPVPNLVSYLFLRDNDYDGVFETTIGSSTGTLTTDPQYLTYQNIADWRVETQWNIACDPTLRLLNQNGIQTQVVRSKSNIKNQRTIGVQDAKNQETRLKVYPNPAKEILNLEFLILNGGQATITIENMLGQVVYTMQTTKPINSINTSLFVPGVYYLKVKTKSNSFGEKLIIE